MTTLEHIVGTTLTTQAIQQDQLLYDAVGFGLIHPNDMRAASRLAMLLNV